MPARGASCPAPCQGREDTPEEGGYVGKWGRGEGEGRHGGEREGTRGGDA